jgi:hypothetical protein
MEMVDHGPTFVQSVIDYVAGQLECVAVPSQIIRTQQSEAALVSMALAGVPEDVPMMTVNETTTHQLLKTLSNPAMQTSLSVASIQGRRASVHMVLDSQVGIVSRCWYIVQLEIIPGHPTGFNAGLSDTPVVQNFNPPSLDLLRTL